MLPELRRTLAGHRSAVLQAPPGAGKTTRVPLALLHEDWLGGKKIVMLEPRRLAARACARYMAGCLGEQVGETVGYRVRLDTRVGATTRIEVVTEGVLARLLQDDPALEAVGLVVFDEFHERSLPADLGLALCLDSQAALRDDLRILVMSATLDGAEVASLLGGAAVALAGFTLYKLITPADDILEGPEGAWTASEMPNLSGKVIIVTGGNSGIGFEAAKEFARKGAHVTLACRNMEKARSAMDEIVAEIPGASVEIMALDLASLDSVRQFATAFNAKHDRLDILVNNAGIMMVPYSETAEGFESQFGVNHLAHFALTGLLLEPLLATPGARVVTISSNAHERGRMDFEDLGFQNGNSYDRSVAYNRSKLANLLFTKELQRRLEESGVDVMAVSAHPGISMTHLADHLIEGPFVDLALPLASKILQSASMGALPTLRAAVDPLARGGDYYGPDGFNSFRGYPVKINTSPAAQDTADAQHLWNVSERLTSVTYDALDQRDKDGDHS